MLYKVFALNQHVFLIICCVLDKRDAIQWKGALKGEGGGWFGESSNEGWRWKRKWGNEGGGAGEINGKEEKEKSKTEEEAEDTEKAWITKRKHLFSKNQM